MPDSTNEPDELPPQIDRYQIKSVIGRGTSAVVYKAFDPHLERKLAIKLIKRANVLDDAQRRSFIQEGRILAQLVHPGIVTIFDVGVFDKKLYIAMELMEGFSLDKVLNTLGKLSSQSLIEVALQIARALHYAHDRGVIHRDIKPENIVLLRDNKTVKLADFGISELTRAVNPLIRGTDEISGTPAYMSPEQIKNMPLDHRTDLYSAGVLFYQLLSGTTPFDNSNVGLLFNKILHEEPNYHVLEQSIDMPDIASDLVSVIRQLLSKEPDMRYQSASDLTIALQKISNRLASSKETESEKLGKQASADIDQQRQSLIGGISMWQWSILVLSIIAVIVSLILINL